MGKKIFSVLAQIIVFILLYEVMTMLFLYIAEIMCYFDSSFWIQFAIRYTFVPMFMIVSVSRLLSLIFKRIHLVTYIFIFVYIFFAFIFSCRNAIVESGLISLQFGSMVCYFGVIVILAYEKLSDIAYPKLKVVKEEEGKADGESEIHP